MNSFSLTILGSSSALPKPDRYTTAHVLNVHERFYLIDCGEGTQIQLRRFRIRFSKIHHIFISHMHGDHFFGLPGLLSSFSLMGRKKPLYLYGPPELKAYLDDLYKHIGDRPGYEIVFYPVKRNIPEVILDTNKLTVTSIPLDHKKDSTGFLFKEKPEERRLIRKKKEQYKIGLSETIRLKKGEHIQRPDGTILNYNEVTVKPPKPRSYAFISDTRYYPQIVNSIQGTDLLYHEATYLHEFKNRAMVTGHSTAKEAALIANQAAVKNLVIGHFSARYKDAEVLLNEARSVFPATQLAFDGLQIDVQNSTETIS